MTESNAIHATQLDRIEARIAIGDLIHGYARCIRYDQRDETVELFTSDCIFEVRDGHPEKPEYSVRERLEGPDQLREYLRQRKGQPHPIPVIHNLIVEVDGDNATANSVMEGQILGTPYNVLGEYRDVVRKVHGRWLFVSRIFTIFK